MAELTDIRWIFFDAGNTLIRLDYARVVDALRKEGFSVEQAALRRAEVPARYELERAILDRWQQGSVPRTGWVEEKLWSDYWCRVLLLSGADEARAPSLAAAVLRITRNPASWDRVDPGTPATLAQIASRGYRLAIISNSSGTLAPQLQALGLARHFEFIIDSGEVGVEKPHPGIFELALSQAGGVSPASALYIGDVYTIDILGATGAGMNAILLDRDDLWREQKLLGRLPDGFRRVSSLAELEDLLK